MVNVIVIICFLIMNDPEVTWDLYLKVSTATAENSIIRERLIAFNYLAGMGIIFFYMPLPILQTE